MSGQQKAIEHTERSFVERLANLDIGADAKHIYGEPVERDGVTVIPAAQILFDLRGAIGKVMHWDDVPQLVEKISYFPRLSVAERTASLVQPSEVRGIPRVLYCFENEMLLEIINKTVHCFWVSASEKMAEVHALYNAVYVKNLNWRTPIYMTLVSPVLKNIIYPAIDKSIRQNWEREFPTEKAIAKTTS